MAIPAANLELVETLIVGMNKELIASDEVSYSDKAEALEASIDMCSEALGRDIFYDSDVLYRKLPGYIDSVQGGRIKYVSRQEAELTLKFLKNQFRTIENNEYQNSMLERFLEKEERISMTRAEMLARVSERFQSIPTKIDKRSLKKSASCGTDVLEVPLSDINLDRLLSDESLEEGFFTRMGKHFTKAVSEQVNSGNRFARINVYFLGNSVGHELGNENHFDVSVVHYNLCYEFSDYLVRLFYVLRKHFPEVRFVFANEKKQMDAEANPNAEYYRNRNFAGEYVVSKLVSDRLAAEGCEGVVTGARLGTNMSHSSVGHVHVIAMGDIDGENRRLKADRNFDPYALDTDVVAEMVGDDARLVLESGEKRVYVGSRRLHVFKQKDFTMRYIPSFYENIRYKGEQLMQFVLDKDGNEIEMLWVDLENEEDLLSEELKRFGREEVLVYDYLKKTTLRAKPRRDKIVILS